jgi:hypothetical protein
MPSSRQLFRETVPLMLLNEKSENPKFRDIVLFKAFTTVYPAMANLALAKLVGSTSLKMEI